MRAMSDKSDQKDLSEGDNKSHKSENETSGSVKSTLVSRNIKVLGKRTSVRLEPEMWKALHDIANREECSIHDICSLISLRKKPKTSLTAAIRVFLMLYYKAASTEQGHQKAGHGDFNSMIGRARITVEEYQSINGDNFFQQQGARSKWTDARA